jgi:mono/diheme cytochrome c family protein
VKTSILSLALFALGCDWMPGKPDPEHVHVRPEQEVDFDALYAKNCSGCHGADGRRGPATPIGEPLYQAWSDIDRIYTAIEQGVAGTAMPAFVEQYGGSLTAEQARILAAEMQKRWGGEQDPGRSHPPYAAPLGSVERGAEAFGAYCADCHGADGTGSSKAGSVVNDSYLALVSTQGLRTAVVVGRPDFGMPNYQGYSAERPMLPQEVSDVVAWLSSKRSEFPGQLPPSPEAVDGTLSAEPAREE